MCAVPRNSVDRPRITISAGQIYSLISIGFTKRKIDEMLGVSEKDIEV